MSDSRQYRAFGLARRAGCVSFGGVTWAQTRASPAITPRGTARGPDLRLPVVYAANVPNPGTRVRAPSGPTMVTVAAICPEPVAASNAAGWHMV